MASYKDFDLNTIAGCQEYARHLLSQGVGESLFVRLPLYDELCSEGYNVSRIIGAFRQLKDWEVLIKKFGANLAEAYIKVYNECINLGLSNFYFDEGFKRTNRYGKAIDCKYPLLYGIYIYGDSYNAFIKIEQPYAPYNEKHIRLMDINASALPLIILLLKEKISAVKAERQKNQWEGDIDLAALVAEVCPRFPNNVIEVRRGKRGNEGNCAPYDAIVICDKDGRGQYGSITIGKDKWGVAYLSCRVPLAGEHSYVVTKESVINGLTEAIQFALS